MTRKKVRVSIQSYGDKDVDTLALIVAAFDRNKGDRPAQARDLRFITERLWSEWSKP